MRPKLLAAFLFASLAATSGTADGYVTAGRPWPGGVIGYYNAAPDQAWALQKAVDAWNESGARVRFVPVPASRAQVTITHFPGVPCTVNAAPRIGYTPDARVYVFNLDQRSYYCNSYMAAGTLAHELGHVLGLGHETRRCAIMNPEATLEGPALCPQARPWQWRCRLLTPDDVVGAIALYGGTARPLRSPRDCDIYAAGRPPSSLRIAPGSAAGQVSVSFRRPPVVPIPVFLATQHQQSEVWALSTGSDRCATDASTAPRYNWNVQPGGVQQIVMNLAPGRYCFAVWAIDSFGRPSTRPARVWARA
jgi:hypothetical protein